MRRIKDVLRYHFEIKMSNEKICRALNTSKGSVHNILKRFKNSSLSWPLEKNMTESKLGSCLYLTEETLEPSETLPDISYLEKELARPHVTLQLLWEEYRQNNPSGLSRSGFYRHFHKNKTKTCVMKNIHKGGDLLYVDYSGDKLFYANPTTGERIDVEVFVSSWGASSYSYAEATHSQSSEDFITSHVRSFEYFKVIPNGLVPDNLKSGVKKSDRYEPELNLMYSKMAEHYSTAVIPARVRKPRDKAIVESNVLHVQRFIFARLRNRQFFSLSEVNEAIWELLEEFNNRPMKDYGGESRRKRFEELDKPYAKALSSESFRITSLKIDVRVAPNYHIRFKDRFYSVPHHLVGQPVDVYQSGNIIEIYHDGVHCCRHQKGARRYSYSTSPDHMPPNHRYIKGWSTEWFLSKAEGVGECCKEVVEQIMLNKDHVQQGFNAALGLLRLERVYTTKRLEAACRRAKRYKSYSLRAVKSILEQNLDKQTIFLKQIEAPPVDHQNIRGASYYN